MPGIINEVVANSNSPVQVFSTAVLANTLANGSAISVSVGGFASPGVFGSNMYEPTAQIFVYVGANGNSSDPLVSSAAIPTTFGNSAFSLSALITVRGNAKSAGVNANAVYSGVLFDPYPGFLPTTAAANGNVNAAWSGANTGNVSIYALAGSGQNASLLIETCFVTLQS